MPSDLYNCRVCGLPQDELPWGEDGASPTFEICDCCGTEFGYEDTTPAAAGRARQKWIANGAGWFRPKRKPENWNPEAQLQGIPADFRS